MRTLVLMISLCMLTACATNMHHNSDFVNPIGFQPVSPVDISEQFEADIILLAEFPNEAVSVAVREITQGASSGYGPAMLSTKGSSYEVKVDYIKYRTHQYTGSEKILREGIGVRMIANVKTSENKIDLGSLYALGVAAEQKKLTGTLTMETMGISGENITPLIPIPSKIDVSTIQNVLQAAAAIKSKIYDNTEGVTVRPQVLAFKFVDIEDTLNAEIAAETLDIEADNKAEFKGSGWVYFGHFINDTYGGTATTDASGLPVKGSNYNMVRQVHVRSSYPSFPMYKAGQSLGGYKPGDKVKVLEVEKVGRNKIWAKVQKQ